MTKRVKILLGALAVSILCLGLSTLSLATTVNPPPSAPGYTPVVLPLQGTYSSTTTGAVAFKAPAGYRVVTANVTARAVTGTNPTLKTIIKNATYKTYSGTVTAAGTPKDLTPNANTTITDEGTVSVDLAAGGTSPKWKDLTIFMLLKRL